MHLTRRLAAISGSPSQARARARPVGGAAVLAGAAALALVVAACGGSDGGDGDGRATDSTELAHASSKAGPGKAAREVCSPMIRRAVEFEVGARLDGPPTEAVAGDTFTCTYRVGAGTIVMSVDDLKRVPVAEEDFRARLGIVERAGTDVERLPGLGHGGFVAPDGGLVVRKDAMVLTIEMAGMPDTVDGRDRGTVATNLGVAVMGCW
jgi:hypothetical protein